MKLVNRLQFKIIYKKIKVMDFDLIKWLDRIFELISLLNNILCILGMFF